MSNTIFDSKTPQLPVSYLAKYLEKIFNVKNLPKNTNDPNEVLEELSMRDVYLPPGLTAGCSVILDRFNVMSAIWNINKKSTLVGVLTENEDEPYVLCSDTEHSGADSLFLLTCSVNDTGNSYSIFADFRNFLSQVYKTNCNRSPKFIAGGFNTDDMVFQCIGVQLSSLS